MHFYGTRNKISVKVSNADLPIATALHITVEAGKSGIVGKNDNTGRGFADTYVSITG